MGASTQVAYLHRCSYCLEFLIFAYNETFPNEQFIAYLKRVILYTALIVRQFD